jgi:hypothetical protein
MLDNATPKDDQPETPLVTTTRKAYSRTRVMGRRGARLGPWLEIGNYRVDEDGVVRVVVDRLPLGFTGVICLALPGQLPPADIQPQRPAPAAETDPDIDPDDPFD